MAIRVKLNRAKVIARLEEVITDAVSNHKKAVEKYNADIEASRPRVAAELRKIADAIEAGKQFADTETIHDPDDRRVVVQVLQVASKIKLPQMPQELDKWELTSIGRFLTLLRYSDEETFSANPNDLQSYGLGSLDGLTR